MCLRILSSCRVPGTIPDAWMNGVLARISSLEFRICSFVPDNGIGTPAIQNQRPNNALTFRPKDLSMFQNPFVELHHEFKQAGAEVILSSGQACVLYGIAAFSKDGDWVIAETEKSCAAVRNVLAGKKAHYRLGAPLDIRWLQQGWTSHFEFKSQDLRIRTDFCSRPPRILDLDALWKRLVTKEGVELVDPFDLIKLKQTRRSRDYEIIGTLAEVLGLQRGIAELAIGYLQDHDLLAEAARRYPDEAAASDREAVRLLLLNAPRQDIVSAIAQEQDLLRQSDLKRIEGYLARMKSFEPEFLQLKKSWIAGNTPLHRQHEQLLDAGPSLLEEL